MNNASVEIYCFHPGRLCRRFCSLALQEVKCKLKSVRALTKNMSEASDWSFEINSYIVQSDFIKPKKAHMAARAEFKTGV